MKRYKKRYLYYYIRHVVRKKILEERFGIPIKRYKVGGRLLPDKNDTNKIISDYINSGEPFALVRPGNGESAIALLYEEEMLFGKQLYKRRSDVYDRFKHNFDGRVDEYQKIFRRDIADADIFATFPGYLLEDYLSNTYCDSSIVVNAFNITPINAARPWTDALKGKRVLVVSQFADYLMEQYSKRDKLYSGDWMFPEMELIPVKSVWYIGRNENFESWFDALDYLFNEIMKHDFDIALLSCGPFAINLASMIKRAGKQAIQYAGELQMLFGIRGARWDNNPGFSKYYNDSWIRVSKKEAGITEEESKKMDGGICYW